MNHTQDLKSEKPASNVPVLGAAMILLRLVTGVVSDEHCAMLNGFDNGLFFAVSENLENILSFSGNNCTSQLVFRFVYHEVLHPRSNSTLKGKPKGTMGDT